MTRICGDLSQNALCYVINSTKFSSDFLTNFSDKEFDSISSGFLVLCIILTLYVLWHGKVVKIAQKAKSNLIYKRNNNTYYDRCI